MIRDKELKDMNPNGPYPGRQLFLGLTVDRRPSLAYLVTGRSPQSRERMATPVENSVIMGPIGNQPYDPLRHYTAVKYDNNTGVAVVSNGIQTEAIFETYRLLLNTDSSPTKHYMEMLLEGAQAEPDSYHTPRIAGVITSGDNTRLMYFVGIIRHDMPATVFQIEPEPGTLIGISTYKGSLDKPESFDPDSDLPKLEFKGRLAKELAEYLFDISHASRNGDDIRVCTIGGVRSDDNRKWQLTMKSRTKRVR